MQISLSSDNYDILANGQVFLFGKEKDLTVKISDRGFTLLLVLRFLEDASEEMKVKPVVTGEREIHIACINFGAEGAGLSVPAKIADMDGRGIYLLFWSFLDGEKGKEVRSVRYTLFYEKALEQGEGLDG